LLGWGETEVQMQGNPNEKFTSKLYIKRGVTNSCFWQQFSVTFEVKKNE